MAVLFRSVLVLLCGFNAAWAMLVTDMDYGGIPLWINRLMGEPSVLSLQGRIDPAWFRANNDQPCPEQCDCPIQWPTSLYCDQRGLENIPAGLPQRTQYLFLQVEQKGNIDIDFFLIKFSIYQSSLPLNSLQPKYVYNYVGKNK